MLESSLNMAKPLRSNNGSLFVDTHGDRDKYLLVYEIKGDSPYERALCVKNIIAESLGLDAESRHDSEDTGYATGWVKYRDDEGSLVFQTPSGCGCSHDCCGCECSYTRTVYVRHGMLHVWTEVRYNY